MSNQILGSYYKLLHSVLQGDFKSSGMVQAWKKLYYAANINIGLAVKGIAHAYMYMYPTRTVHAPCIPIE